MKKVVLAAALAVAGLIGNVETASAACTWGGWSPYTFSMNGSFNSLYTECKTANTWAGVFKARAWEHGECALGAGCRKVSARRVTVWSPNQCILPGIGVQARAHIVNVVTGTSTPDVLVVNNENTACGTDYGHTVSGYSWFNGVKCRIAHSCP